MDIICESIETYSPSQNLSSCKQTALDVPKKVQNSGVHSFMNSLSP
ncbi:hypothetical protein LEP1GSC192_0040 [Leptospira sp. B5-022]|nr:hypothetical protein LEP1GSC192_0040 [Leptospira sp. B5-022]